MNIVKPSGKAGRRERARHKARCDYHGDGPLPRQGERRIESGRMHEAKGGLPMIFVTGQVRFAAGEIERLTPAFRMNVQATRAEPGCARYAYAVDVADPDLLHVVEEWSDEEAVNAHMNTPHMAELMAALGTATIEAISINAYEAHFLKALLGGGAG
jgi:quinol monooxygenase YgiN